MMRTTLTRTCAVCLIALLAACSSSEIPGLNNAHASSAAAAAAVAGPTRALPDFSALVERVGSAVVNVSTVRNPEATADNTPAVPPGAENDPF